MVSRPFQRQSWALSFAQVLCASSVKRLTGIPVLLPPYVKKASFAVALIAGPLGEPPPSVPRKEG